jgi:hypothetical protein
MGAAVRARAVAVAKGTRMPRCTFADLAEVPVGAGGEDAWWDLALTSSAAARGARAAREGRLVALFGAPDQQPGTES